MSSASGATHGVFRSADVPTQASQHTGAGSLGALAVLLVVKIRGAHISVLSGLEKTTGKNNPPWPPATCVHSLSVLGQAQSLLGGSEGTGGSGW